MAVTTCPFPGLPSSGMVTANLARVPVGHMAAHLHALVSRGRLMTFNRHGQIKSHPTWPVQLLLPFSLLEID